MTEGIVLGPVAGVTAIIIGLPVGMSLLALCFRYTSCWNKLERRYLARDASFGQILGFPVFRIASPFDPGGWLTSFRNVICVGVADGGLLLKAIWPLQLIFRPILIPWDEMLISDEQYIGMSREEVFLTHFPRIQFIFGRSMTGKLRQAAAIAPHAVSS